MNNPTIAELKQAEQRIREHHELPRGALEEPLTVDERGFLVSGMVWIPPFVTDFWSHRCVKPKPKKCVCTSCGQKHNLKGA